MDCTADAILYESNNNELQMITDATWRQIDCYSEPAKEDGYQLVHIDLSAPLQLYYDSTMNLNYTGLWISSGWYDWYTGCHFPARSTTGDDTAVYVTMIDVDGVSYDVSCTRNVEWEQRFSVGLFILRKLRKIVIPSIKELSISGRNRKQ